MHTQLHEAAKWLSTGCATLTAWATMNGEDLLAWTGTAIAVLSAASSWLIAQRAQVRKAQREQANLDAINSREQRWLDAIAEWQIAELRAGKIQPPRNRSTDIPAAPDHLPELPT